MFLAIVLAVLVTLIPAEAASLAPVSQGSVRALLMLGGVGIVAFAAWVITQGTISALRRREDHGVILRNFERWQLVHAMFWVGVSSWIQLVLKWPAVIRCNLQLDTTILVDDLLLLAPMMFSMLLTWAFYFDVELSLHDASTLTDKGGAWRDRARYVVDHARHYFGFILLPVLVLLLVRDCLQSYWPSSLEGQNQSIALAVPLLIISVFYPTLLRVVWPTRRVSNQLLFERLRHFARRWNVRLRDILVWRQGSSENAAVVGFLPITRYILISDGLLTNYDDDEIEAVFAHEVGHACQHHLVLRLLALLAPFLAWEAASTSLPELTGSPLLPVLAIVHVVFVFGRYARMLEHEADMWAFDRVDREVLLATMHRLGLRSGNEWTSTSWLHPSLCDRVHFLHAIQSPKRRRRFRLRSRMATAAVIATIFLSVLVSLR